MHQPPNNPPKQKKPTPTQNLEMERTVRAARLVCGATDHLHLQDTQSPLALDLQRLLLRAELMKCFAGKLPQDYNLALKVFGTDIRALSVPARIVCGGEASFWISQINDDAARSKASLLAELLFSERVWIPMDELMSRQ